MVAYVATPQRRMGGVFLGAALFGGLSAFHVASLFSPGRIVTFGGFLLSFIACSLVALAGIMILAFPIWRALEKRRGRAGWGVAILFGFILSPTWFALVALAGTRVLLGGEAGLATPFIAIGGGVLALLGMLIALVMWRFAYRPANSAPN